VQQAVSSRLAETSLKRRREPPLVRSAAKTRGRVAYLSSRKTGAAVGLRAISGGLSVAEERTVSAPVLRQYELFKRRFDAWLSDSARMHTLASAEVNIVDYLDVLLHRNANYGELEKSTAAVIFFTPGAAKHDMPWVKSALKGCLKAKPPRSRLPLPDEVVYGLAGILLSLGHKAVALMVILGKEEYMRPMEMVSLSGEDLRAPVGGAQVGLQL